MRRVLPVLSLAVLAACQSGSEMPGVGFGDYQTYLNEREGGAAPAVGGTALSAGTVTSAPLGSAPPPAPVPSTLGTTTPMMTASAPPTGPAVPAPDHVGISDENDFSAVASRETIESDKARIAANRASYVQVQPTALPERTGDTGPNIVEYALQATNRLGESVFRRSSLALANHDRACAGYASPDLAQQDFLRRGGPRRDPKNLDPDGDGFACAWDPTPFQTAARGG